MSKNEYILAHDFKIGHVGGPGKSGDDLLLTVIELGGVEHNIALRRGFAVDLAEKLRAKLDENPS